MSDSTNRQSDVYVMRGSKTLRQLVARRSLDREASYIKPYLDNLAPNFVFADIGCGPGSISMDVAKKYPQCLVLAVDVGAPEIEDAKHLAKEAGLTNVRFTVGNAMDLEAVAAQPGFEDLRGNCDVVHEHMTMMHVSSPQTMIKEMRKAAKVGGIVACRDHDPGMNTVYPSSHWLDKYLEYQPRWISMSGADPQAARKLLHFAINAGFRREDIKASMGDWLFSDVEEKRIWLEYMRGAWSESAQIDKMLELSGTSVDRVQMVKEWEEWAAKPDAWYALPAPQIICRKVD